MAGLAPILVQEKLLLPSIGIAQEFISFKSVSFESEKFICVRENGAQPTVVIIDMSNPLAPARRQISADSALMCLDKKVIALKATVAGTSGDSLQVFNLDTKTKLKAYQMPENVEYWKWISPSALGLVTAASVYHWDVEGAGDPVKVFDRTPNLAGSQIISYRTSPDSKWSVLIGIAPGAPERPQLAKGLMQLYSFEQQKSQPLEAHAASFATVKFAGRDAASLVISFAQKTLKEGQIVSKLHVIELGGAAPGGAVKRQAELFFPAEFADDFPVSLQISDRFGLIYVITKLGLLFVYDLETATAVFRNRISPDPIFLACNSEATGGFYAINRSGQVVLATVNEATLVSFVAQQLNNVELALAIAKRGNLPGAEQLIGQQFERVFSEGRFKEAAELAAESPQGILRTREVVERLKSAPPQPGTKPPILIYLGVLLQKGKLNTWESAELARLVLGQNKKELLVNWWNEGKLECSEELADMMSAAGEKDLALKMYQLLGNSGKIIATLAEKGDFAGLAAYTGQTGQTLNWMQLLQSQMMTSPSGAVALAKMIVKQTPSPIDVGTISELFISRQMVREATAFLLEALAGDRPEQAPLQSKLLEINLISNPAVADAILAGGSLTHYDRPRIAQLCEKAGLYMRALQHYTELTDIKRTLANTHAIPPQELSEFFGTLSAEWALECLKELLVTNAAQNLQLVVNIAREYTEQLGSGKIIELLEAYNCYNGMYLYLGSRMAVSEDPEEHYKYIEAAARTGQLGERVKAFLMEAKLPDARPLINVCNRFDMVGDLTQYLFTNNMLRYIEGYVQKVNPAKTPQVVAALLDAEADDAFINNLILSVRSLLPVDALVEEVEKRNRLKLLLPFLEHLISEGSSDPHVHNALGKIVIDTNNNPEHFLTTNPYYDSLVVGKYAEKRDPNLACVAYKRGHNDDALVECTNKHSLFKLQARYVVERSDPELWAKVLDEAENKHRRALIDQVVSTALPESRHPEQVSATVKAFMAARLESELIELLEKIVLQNSAFSNNANLQNLLILTAIKADRSRVKDYINRLDNFDGPAVADKAIEKGLYEEAFLIFQKFSKKVDAIKVLLEHLADLERAADFALKADEAPVWSELGHAQLEAGEVSGAIASHPRAPTNHTPDTPDPETCDPDPKRHTPPRRSAVPSPPTPAPRQTTPLTPPTLKPVTLTTDPQTPPCRSAVPLPNPALRQTTPLKPPTLKPVTLTTETSNSIPQVSGAIASYLRSGDTTRYVSVTDKAKGSGCYDELVKYLLMVRKKVKDAKVDTELVYAYAKTANMTALEEFIAGTHQANLQACGDRAFDEGLYDAARVLFTHIPNYGRLASTLVKLRSFQAAVDAARKANSPKSWKEVAYACVEEREFRLAQLCGLNIIVNADDLEEVSDFYQRGGHFDELIALLESGIGLERAHMGIFTELGLMYAKYRHEKLAEHLKLFSARLNIPRLIRVCEEQQHWKELTFLYIAYDEFDNAAYCMMAHSPSAWEHVQFKDVAVRVSSGEVHYRAIYYYLDEHPQLLVDLLNTLQSRVDHARVVELVRKAGHLPLIKEYLLAVQKNNVSEVNEAVNALLVEEEDYEGLSHSIQSYDSFDQVALAAALERHELLEFRRVAAQVYKKNLRWRKAVELAKADGLFKDAMETTAQSGDCQLAEELLKYFIEDGDKECFAATLYTCYDLIKADTVLELAWLHGLMDFAFPYLIQVVKEYTGKVDTLLTERKDDRKEKEEQQSAVRRQEQVQNQYASLMPLALPAPPAHAGGQIPGGQGYDMGGFQGAAAYGGGAQGFQGYH
ncbi:MAG: hypothetical protein WDW36_009606 [Sanguina aurantia]